MPFRISFLLPATRCTPRLGASLRNLRYLEYHPVHARFASNSSPPRGSAQFSAAKSQRKSNSPTTRSQADASRKASLLLSRLSKASKKTSSDILKFPDSEQIVSPSVIVASKESPPANAEGSEQKNVEIDEIEEAIQRRILLKRTKLLWPGIWTIFAVTGTYGILAYLDTKYNPEVVSGNTPHPERAQLPQSWFLTPAVIQEGLKAGWNELDKLTIGIVLASVGIHFMKRSPLPFWEHLIHITGEKKYTAFTYPFAHSTWAHIGQNMFALCWFLPGVVHYFNGDLFHTAAFFASVPLVTSYLQHFAFRWSSIKGVPLNMGSSGAIAAVFGAFCMAYPDEKVWMPSFVILRLDAKYWGALFAFWQLAAMVKTPKGGNRPAFIVHLVSLGIGAAYVSFDGRNNVWKPLTSRLSKYEEAPVS
ncbi:Nn.00g027790.m01.CDS01 [Neocucurbitaria sp. VM-36]